MLEGIDISATISILREGGFAAATGILLLMLWKLGNRYMTSVENLHTRIGATQERLVQGQDDVRDALPTVCKFDPRLHCANFSAKGSQ